MEWWCAATERAWDWTPRPYVGSWLLTITALSLYAAAWRRWAPPADTPERQRRRRRQIAAFVGGVLVFHASVDWPIGTLGAGYLASVGMARFILITLVAAPLLLRGTPVWLARKLLPEGPVRNAVRAVSRGLPALLIFNLTLIITKAPAFTDPLLSTQVGAMAMDLAWLAAGLVLWMPVISPLPEIPRLPAPVAMAYLFGQSVIPTIPSAFLTFAEMPLYETYELAPRVGDIDATLDQRNAGLIMKIGGAILLWARIATIWFRWAASEERPDEVTRPDVVFDDALEDSGLRPEPERPPEPGPASEP